MFMQQSDDKDKIFTNVINREPVNVIVQTSRHRIDGKIFIRPEEQLRDEINRPSAFLELYDVTVYNDMDQLIFSNEMIAINRNQIIWILTRS